MTRGDYGVWEVKLHGKDGQLGIPHNTKLKVRNMASAFLIAAIDKETDIHGHSHIARAY